MTTTIVYKNAKDIRESWMDKLAKTVVSREGVSQYDDRGKLIKEIKSTKEDIQSYSKMEQHNKENPSSGLPKETWDFKLTPELIAELTANGYKTEKLKGNAVKVSNDKMATIYDPVNKTTSNIHFDKGIVESAITTQYIEVNGSFYPKVKSETRIIVSPSSGACMEKITLTQYSNYKISNK
jgi:hypothetical protein